MPDTIAIACTDLGFSYEKGRPIFENVDFSLRMGEIAAICGPSGCGKSTFIHTLLGVCPEQTGGVLTGSRFLFGENVDGIRLRDMADRLFLVFQEPSVQLFSPTVEDELAFAPENLGIAPAEINARMNAALDTVSMQAFRYNSPDNLSGGEQQRVAFACALATSPRLYLLDEAFSQLDAATRRDLLSLTRKLAAAGNAVLMIEHSTANMEIADSIYRMENKGLTRIK